MDRPSNHLLPWPIMKRAVFIWLVVLGGIARAGAQAAHHISMEELRRLRLPEVVLESATPPAPDIQQNPRAAAYVTVKGVIGGHIRFELLLPEAWNGRFVMGGGGGFVGTVQNSARGSVNGGYVTVGTDTGHEWQPGYMAGWALDDLEAKLNFGYLAVHRTAEVAKALIRAYYGSDDLLLLYRLLARRRPGHDGGATVPGRFQRHRGRRAGV